MRKTLISGIIAACALLPCLAVADDPQTSVAFVVPFPPGDTEDVLTRMIAEDFQTTYGVPASVVNRPGGGPLSGAIAVATAPADGRTVGSFGLGVSVVGPGADLTPNPFEPLGAFLTYPFVIVSSKEAPYASIDALAAHAQNTDVILGHFGAELIPTKVTLALAQGQGFSFARDAAFDLLDCNTLTSGDVDVMSTRLQLVLPCIDKINVLASITEARLGRSPDTPTVAELAPDLTLSLWHGLFVHKDMPQDARDKIAAVARTTLASKRARAVTAATGALIYWRDAAETTARIKADTDALRILDAMLE